jgi:hypothetical protein
MDDEEQRAAAYRAQAVRRAKAIAARQKALAGDPALRLQLAKNWAPLYLYQQERKT